MRGELTKLRERGPARVGAILLASAFVFQQPLSTATIVVDGGCSLADAITASNTDTATGGCAAGSGIDTIELTGDVTLVEALPTVTEGAIFEGGGFTVGRYPTAPDFRILDLDVGGTVELRDIKIVNGAATDGGGIRRNDGQLTLFNATVSGNEATSRGGGIYGTFSADPVSITASTISDNTANLGGGIYSGFGGTLVINSSTISGNAATDNGGGIYNVMYNHLTVTNSTLSGNVAGDRGGGLYNQFYAGNVELVNTTVIGNGAVDGGGFYAYPVFAATPQGHYTEVLMENTLIAANGGGNCVGDGQQDLGGNFDDDGSCLGASPVAAGVDFDVNLADNGGPTTTHALLPGSAAIDAGGACGLSNDQRGFARDVLCDSGSFELGAAAVGGSVEDVRLVRVTCRNDTTPGTVTFNPAPGATSWNCEAQGLAVNPGDTVSQVILGGASDTAGVGGALIGLAAERASCRNATTGQTVNLLLTSGPSFDCVAAGLVVNTGDRVRLLTRGQVH